MKTIRVIIKGIVQGVYYRKWTVETAQNLGLKGWVRNCKNGNVEAVFSGKSDIVDTIIEKCWQGSKKSKVSDIEIFEEKTTDFTEKFEKRKTV